MNNKEKKRATAAGTLKKYFITGIATISPVFITVYVIAIIYHLYNRFIGRYVSAFFVRHYGFSIPGFGIVFIIAVILFIGFLSSHFIGRRLIPFMEKQINRIPFVEKITLRLNNSPTFYSSLRKKRCLKKWF